ncbi:DUF2807 domain-containing protein [uncultured Algibacter sp.]|uniref:GIN domain-containing protein n=1 Tax=uncultured Algibacter sp. TaxID=298659 RepID=UPI00321712BC
MKKRITLLFNLLICFTITAQTLEKVKGNRVVITQLTDISPFHSIALDEDFDIEIIYNKVPMVEVETDGNLQEFIAFQVIDSVLTFNKTRRITSKKRLNIKVNYDDALRHIETSGDAKIHSLTTMNLVDGSLKATGESKVGLTIKSNSFKFEGDDKAKVKLNVVTENCSINLSGNTRLEAFISSTQFAGVFYQRAVADIEGSTNEATIELDNNTKFEGKNFTINTCNIISQIGGYANLEVTDNITIEASGTSVINLYKDPKIIINKFSDTVKLLKKVK